MKWLTKHRETLVPLLVAAVLVLTLANLVRHEVLTASRLAGNKDSLAALSSAINIVVLLIGAVFSYYRFFRGRTFFSRAEVSITVDVIDTSEEFYLHFICIEIKNIGTLSIWNPLPTVEVTFEGPQQIKPQLWNRWHEASVDQNKKEQFTVIDSGETASFVNYHRVAKSVWAVGYAAFVQAESGEIWKRAIMAPNIPKERIAP